MMKAAKSDLPVKSASMECDAIPLLTQFVKLQ